MAIEFEHSELTELTPKIAVIGVGGAGCNAVNNMIAANLQGVGFVVANTDAQSLLSVPADTRIQLGVEITQGLGAGAQPKVGEAAAEESLEIIDKALDGVHMAFITAGMGGGTGTGASPVIARRARDKGILTVGVVTRPFMFEGGRRMKIAEAGIRELAGHVDTLIIIPNQNLFNVANERTTFAEAFEMADDVLHSGVRSITDLMVMPGLINLDFADVRTVMSEMGKAMMGTGEAEGEERARMAAEAAISNQLLEDASLKGAKGVIINVTGGMDMTLYEVDEAVNMVRALADPDALIVFGSAYSEALDGKLRVSVVATGIEGGPAPVRRLLDDGVDTNMSTVSDAENHVADSAATAEVASDGPQGSQEKALEEQAAPSAEPASEEVFALQAEDIFVAEAPVEVVEETETLQPADPDREASYMQKEPAETALVQRGAANSTPQPSFFQKVTRRFSGADAKETAIVNHMEKRISNDTGVVRAEDRVRSSEQAAAKNVGVKADERQRPANAPQQDERVGADQRQETASQRMAEPSIGGVAADERPAPKLKGEQMEIPAFLRRQHN